MTTYSWIYSIMHLNLRICCWDDFSTWWKYNNSIEWKWNNYKWHYFQWNHWTNKHNSLNINVFNINNLESWLKIYEFSTYISLLFLQDCTWREYAAVCSGRLNCSSCFENQTDECLEESKDEYWFKCTESKWCMDEEVRCNQEVDCDDKSDEESCGKITISLLLI